MSSDGSMKVLYVVRNASWYRKSTASAKTFVLKPRSNRAGPQQTDNGVISIISRIFNVYIDAHCHLLTCVDYIHFKLFHSQQCRTQSLTLLASKSYENHLPHFRAACTARLSWRAYTASFMSSILRLFQHVKSFPFNLPYVTSAMKF